MCKSKTRQKKDPTDAQKALRHYRKHSNRHVLVVETDLSHVDKCQVFALADQIRRAGNELVAIMKTNYENLMRTRRYLKLQTFYGKYLKNGDTDNKKMIANQMSDMQKQYGVTWDVCRKSMEAIGNKYELPSIFSLSKAEDVWKGVEKCLYANGETLHFSKRGDLPGIRAKQINRGIILKSAVDHLHLTINDISFGLLVKDRFQQETVNAILDYLKQPDVIDVQAASAYQNGQMTHTYRPCYVTLMCQTIRGKLRVYAHIAIEGVALSKLNKNGQPKHKLGVGPIGCDIGTQTIAYTSNTHVGFKNLAERGSSIRTNERSAWLLLRAMERSRRATNPNNYNPDGTIKKGRKKWRYSKHYQRLKKQYADRCRKAAINRHLAINQDVNMLRALGDVFVTEPKNAAKLKKRAKKTTVNKNGKINRKKRFGLSIQNRCPGYFQAQVKRKFENTGGTYLEVDNTYKASQYDHTADDYIKKTLSQRLYPLQDGTIVQRDWYSSHLLYVADIDTLTIDKKRCLAEFDKQYQRQLVLIQNIKDNKLKIMNSGIKIA